MEAAPMAFLTEPEPGRYAPHPVAPGITRLVAPNPGPMTYHGTNTYLIAQDDGYAVLDPGPDDAGHIAAVLAATDGRVARILVSHTHPDHVEGVAALQQATGAPVAAWHAAGGGLAPDIPLRDGDEIGGLVALHTPGHAADHVCFATSGGVLFSADHVMSWSTSVVNPPDGDMAAYFDSLRRVLAREDALYLPGHGPALPEPRRLVRAMLAHRMARENAIAAALRENPHSAGGLVEMMYGMLAVPLRPVAERSVVAHLLKLESEGRARRDDDLWHGVG
ncbi:MAG TPA: MBL fold metallo-hydrolase [Acetobacteraceae bacterium]|nr:MBL fold metallo-hydrolase [Acetobacteraceae bacterium]